MATVEQVDANKLIEHAAAALEKVEEIKAPEWGIFVKTGAHKERPPVEPNWWEVRTAAVLRTGHLKGPIGVNTLRVKYGGNKNRGHKPSRFYKGSGNIARKVLQQLEKAGLIKQTQKGVHKGRVTTPAGKKLLDTAANQVNKK